MSEGIKIITTNRKARHEYHISETLEVGIVLQGTEVKSLREGRANLQEAFCSFVDGELLLMSCHISPFKHGGHFNHDPLRPRKLLLHRRELKKWDTISSQKGFTITPLKMYFKAGKVKLEIGLAKGKKLFDKRSDIADRESKRKLDRVMKEGIQ
ncbi:MAG: SsrA-binding protein SmpB [Rhodothermales bacterium]